ncbi:unnamed protein product [Toxocara canis]|uniref:Uncharacterized protein n=1 Tax=Toxocara canis TaxID=6265 RepID=A0A183UC70_TOXCA|nr:unnamed protein product [Toxocara canis]
MCIQDVLAAFFIEDISKGIHHPSASVVHSGGPYGAVGGASKIEGEEPPLSRRHTRIRYRSSLDEDGGRSRSSSPFYPSPLRLRHGGSRFEKEIRDGGVSERRIQRAKRFGIQPPPDEYTQCFKDDCSVLLICYMEGRGGVCLRSAAIYGVVSCGDAYCVHESLIRREVVVRMCVLRCAPWLVSEYLPPALVIVMIRKRASQKSSRQYANAHKNKTVLRHRTLLGDNRLNLNEVTA